MTDTTAKKLSSEDRLQLARARFCEALNIFRQSTQSDFLRDPNSAVRRTSELYTLAIAMRSAENRHVNALTKRSAALAAKATAAAKALEAATA